MPAAQPRSQANVDGTLPPGLAIDQVSERTRAIADRIETVRDDLEKRVHELDKGQSIFQTRVDTILGGSKWVANLAIGAALGSAVAIVTAVASIIWTVAATHTTLGHHSDQIKELQRKVEILAEPKRSQP